MFRFFLYIEGMYEQLGSLKVLSYNYHFAVNAVGVKKRLRFQAFKGYLQEEERNVRPAEHDEIITVLQRVPTAGINSSSCCLRKPDSESGKSLV